MLATRVDNDNLQVAPMLPEWHRRNGTKEPLALRAMAYPDQDRPEGWMAASSAGSCVRKRGYDVAGVEKEEMDESGLVGCRNSFG